MELVQVFSSNIAGLTAISKMRNFACSLLAIVTVLILLAGCHSGHDTHVPNVSQYEGDTAPAAQNASLSWSSNLNPDSMWLHRVTQLPQPCPVIDPRFPNFSSVYDLLPTISGGAIPGIGVSTDQVSESDRELSYIEGTAIGSQFLTYANMLHRRDIAQFNPKWDGSKEFDEAFKIYKLDMTGIADNPLISFHWVSTSSQEYGPRGTPEDESWADLSVGLSNVSTGNWEWYQPAGNTLYVTSLAPYIDQNNIMLVNLLFRGIDCRCLLEHFDFNSQEQQGSGGAEYTAEQGKEIPKVYHSNVFPSMFSLHDELPPVGDQTGTGSCQSWSAIGAFNYELSQIYGSYGWDISNEDPDVANQYIASTRYAFIETCHILDQYLGDSVIPPVKPDVLDYLISYGCATEAMAPWNYPLPEFWTRIDVSNDIDKILSMDLEDYWSIRNTVDTRDHLVEDYKTILVNHQRPLLFTYGSHSSIIVGFDDAKTTWRYPGYIGCFLVRDSYGPTPGEEGAPPGHEWFPYELSEEHIKSATCVKAEYDPETEALFLGTQTAYPPPRGVKASADMQDDFIVLNWQQSPGATGYNIYRDRPDNQVVEYLDSTEWIDWTASDGLTHAYWIQACFGSQYVVSELSRPELGWTAKGSRLVSHENVHNVGKSMAIGHDQTGRLHLAWIGFSGSPYVATAIETEPGTMRFSTYVADPAQPGVEYNDLSIAQSNGQTGVLYQRSDGSSAMAKFAYNISGESFAYIEEPVSGLYLQNAGATSSLRADPANESWHIMHTDNLDEYHIAKRLDQGMWVSRLLRVDDLPVAQVNLDFVPSAMFEPWRSLSYATDPDATDVRDFHQLIYGSSYMSFVTRTRVPVYGTYAMPKWLGTAYCSWSDSFCDTDYSPAVFNVAFNSVSPSIATQSVVSAAYANTLDWDVIHIETCLSNAVSSASNHGLYGDAVFLPERSTYACVYHSGVQAESLHSFDMGDLKLALKSGQGLFLSTIDESPGGKDISISHRNNKFVVFYVRQYEDGSESLMIWQED